MPDLLAGSERDLRGRDGPLPGLRAFLRRLDDGLWVHETALRFFVQMGRRMVVVRVSGDDLMVHSPAELSPQVRASLDDLGQVRFVVPASSFHGHLFMEQYAEAYPDAELFSAPRLARKRRDLTFAGELGDTPDPRWSDLLDQAVFRGHRLLEEVVFLHRPSRSLIVGDTYCNFQSDAPLATRLWGWGSRRKRRAGPTPPFRAAVRDKRAARASIDRILEWDFDRIVVGHGDVVETGGKQAFRAAWEWIPSSPS